MYKSNIIHVVCECKLQTKGNFSEKQINAVSNSLTASANYLRKLVEGDRPRQDQNDSPQPSSANNVEKSTIAVHGDASYEDLVKGLCVYDGKEVDTPAFTMKYRAYTEVENKYPGLKDLVRDEKVKALKELKSVGFRYFTIQVTAFVEKDGMTYPVDSKTHHRLDKPSRESLEKLLVDTFGATIRPPKDSSGGSNNVKADAAILDSSGPTGDIAGDGSPNV